MEWYCGEKKWLLLSGEACVGILKQNPLGEWVSSLTVEGGNYSISDTVEEAKVKCESHFISWCKKACLTFK